MTTNETPGPSGTVPDQYLEDISADELSANAPADETAAKETPDVNATESGTNGADVSASPSPYVRKRNKWHRHLRESLPIRNLAEALDQVESWVHTTPEQCLMSITTIAR
jgi:hypothetical protein